MDKTKTKKQIIIKAIYDFIFNNYGGIKEANDPCYDIEEMAEFINERLGEENEKQR